jgi:hypothetical protein
VDGKTKRGDDIEAHVRLFRKLPSTNGGCGYSEGQGCEASLCPYLIENPPDDGGQTGVNIFGVIAPQSEADKDVHKRPHKMKEKHCQIQTLRTLKNQSKISTSRPSKD